MRRKHIRIFSFLLVLCFLLYKFHLHFKFIFIYRTSDYQADTYPLKNSSKLMLNELVTIVIRQFDLYDNDVSATAQSVAALFPTITTWIVYDDKPYPPIDLKFGNQSVTNVKLHSLTPSLLHKQSLLSEIETKYIIFIPDGVRITSLRPIEIIIEALNAKPYNMIAVGIAPSEKSLKCLRINVSRRDWTIKYSVTKGTECDAVNGKHILVARNDVLQKLSEPLLLPFPQTLYIQASFQNVKVSILKVNSIYNGPQQFNSHHIQLRRQQVEQENLRHFCKQFKVKQILRETGSAEWYGCTKNTSRCFPPVLDFTPSYLYEGKWTPPCCIANLRKTARHVFSILDEAGVRYWLEAGSLLGAMRSGDILPWDYNVDVGIVREDLNRCKWFQKCQSKPAVDKKGFLWEKATDGNWFKVSYSKTNKIQVNIFPFYSKNGSMVRHSWFTRYKNMEFAESFLHPMSSINFVGRSVPSPNNIRDFLEYKYGKGCIEKPEFPNPDKLKFFEF